jgi:hypothetical protein
MDFLCIFFKLADDGSRKLRNMYKHQNDTDPAVLDELYLLTVEISGTLFDKRNQILSYFKDPDTF